MCSFIDWRLLHCSFYFAFGSLCLVLTETLFPDDIEDDLCIASNDSRNVWGLWGREVWVEIWVRHPYLPFISHAHVCLHTHKRQMLCLLDTKPIAEKYSFLCFNNYFYCCFCYNLNVSLLLAAIHTWQLFLILVRHGLYIALYSSTLLLKINYNQLNHWQSFWLSNRLYSWHGGKVLLLHFFSPWEPLKDLWLRSWKHVYKTTSSV